MTAEPGRAQADCPRSTRAEVRNPVLALPAARILATIDLDTRALLALLFSDLQQEARARAHQNWNRHKAVMAAYWSAVATYAGHVRRTLYGPAGNRNRTPLLLRQPGYSPIPVRDWAEASAATATVAATNRLTLTFSERLMPQLSGIDLAMTGMPGMANHAPMKIGGVQTTVGEDGKTLIAALPRPLAAGTYKLDWHVVSVDTHRIAGSLTFTVR